MKTTVLIGMFSLFFLIGKAQYSPTGFKDDFINSSEYENLHWGNVDPLSSVYQITRNNVLKELDVVVNQPKATYNDMEITFGKTSTGAMRTIDLTNNSDYSLSIENGVSGGSVVANEIQAMLYIVDSLGRTIDHDVQGYKTGTWDIGAWIYSIAMVLGEGEAGIIKKNAIGYGGTVLSGSFKNGYYMCYNNELTLGHTANTYYKDCDLSKIARVRIRINHSAYDMINQPVYIKNITIGTVTLGINEKNITKNDLKIYPNPVTNGIINFETEVQNIQIFNNQGVLVKSIERTKSVDVTDLSAGIYFVNTSKGQSKFIID